MKLNGNTFLTLALPRTEVLLCAIIRGMLSLFISALRWVQKHLPWLHWPPLDRLIVKLWRYLVEK